MLCHVMTVYSAAEDPVEREVRGWTTSKPSVILAFHSTSGAEKVSWIE